MLNYSFQTGEEFAVEFMQERANLRTHFVPKNSSSNQIQPSPIMSSIAQRSQSSIPTLRMDNTTHSKNIGRKTLGSVSEFEKRTSSSIQRSSRRFLPLSSNCNFTEPSIIKFLCSFGGNFLPRPSDGKIRYVGGETYILQLSKDITWKELVEKTMRLYNKAHMIKYQLPGENIHVLILVSCDEDVHHMIEECDVLQGGEEKPRLFLFSSQDEDDYSDMHFGTGSADTNCEMKFVAAINGASSTGSMGFFQDPTNMKGVASVGDLDQLIFDIDSDSTNGTNHYSGHEFTIPHKKMSFMEKIPTKGSSNKMIPINQEYIGRYDEGGDNFLQNSNNLFGKDAGKIRMASSVPSKFKSKNISKPVYTQKELSPLDILKEFKVETKETQNFENKLFSPKLKRQVSGLNYVQSIKVSSPESSKATSGDDPFFGSTSNFGYSKYEDDFNSLNYTILSEDSLVRFSRPEDEGHLIHSEGKLDGEAVLKNNAKSTKMGKDECIDLVQDTEKYFTKSFNKQTRFGSQEDEERKKGNIVRQNTIERSDPDSSIKSRKSNAIIWHDDMGISFNSGSLVRKLAKEEFSLNNYITSQAKKNNSETSENKKEEVDLVSGSSEERRKESFEMDPVQQAYHTSAKTRPNSIRSEGGSSQIGHLSQEDRDSVKLPLFEHEEFEDEGEYEASLQKVNLLGKDFDLSNLQIISNEDLEDLRELGSGAFGTVYHGKWRGTDVAIKRIKNSCFTYQSSPTDKLVQEFWREAAILSKLHHPNVLAFYGVVKDGPGVSLATVTEFMVSGSLKRVLLRRDRYLDQRKRIMLAMDASIGMEYLHAKGVVHFDLKCDNLLVNLKDPSRPICKVGDFGLSKMKETTMVSGGMRGTLPWMAPEQLSMSSNKVSEKIDVYSFGIVMWEILTCDEPYDGMHYGQVIGGILSNTLRPPIPKSCDMDWRNLMERCWAANPNDRPSFTEITSCLRIMLDACSTKSTN
ncbi:hypothetical protein LUZ60_006551 [Juncus effusus]|nr:hypothetical protein LUZ60_006551 [Juncus effusus]